MKSILPLVFFLFAVVFNTNAQINAVWSIPKQELIFGDKQAEMAKMWIDPGFRFADIEFQDKSFRVFFHRNKPILKKARIVDNETQMEVARGRGDFFWGSARFIFETGENIKVLRKRNPNGYEIIGPYGTLFKVENHGISPVKIFNEKDFLAQAFFIFDRIKDTQTPPAEVIMQMNPIPAY
ncbi:hypothetical protein P872_15700 [Rhodonellum psychrophilum GCM71 = DSM 17998]|uniref:FecR protein domain-containing protein n=2 Tax=Rhodonellum TaxID=336827 RepID=U5BUB6_9BACT|nr:MULTISPECIES: hypothetical protein [Rhodonellum]ERM84225.1 hypothetical protein P872_15700 [Rhodonellum psychrophilum GCM71 = DSM 17998]MDO9554121.1 hypothetical protein [Rhodonellum sp.]SDZ18795.1 hypothetical protein SAMN05444412_10795 [Rhodonellum ikkaensis]